METTISYEEIQIRIGNILLNGNLRHNQNSQGIILFSHGSGSSRFSRRNNYVANLLFRRNISSLLLDLLTEEEDAIYENRFNIDLLTYRLSKVTNWVLTQDELKGFPVAYFGASTGAASALRAAALIGDPVKAVVSRGGRPDLSMQYLDKVTAPTLLIVGGDDTGVIELNQQAQTRLAGPSKLAIIPGASHLFEEPGKLEIVAKLAGDWFERYLNS